MKIGDKVSFLSDTGGGIIAGFRGKDIVLVEDADGFQIPTSIKDVVVNDFSKILNNSRVERIYVNGGKAYELYHKYAEKVTGIQAVKLPSTSPANAAWSLEKLTKVWKETIEFS